MNLQKTYPSLLAADLAAAEGWYTKLLGRGPDHRPMPTLLHWELSDEGGLMLSSSKDIATRGAIFLYVADLAAERRRLEGLGIALGNDNEGDYSTLAQLRDPDGNLITFASPPDDRSRPHDGADDPDSRQAILPDGRSARSLGSADCRNAQREDEGESRDEGHTPRLSIRRARAE